jgi:hypothetical protein
MTGFRRWRGPPFAADPDTGAADPPQSGNRQKRCSCEKITD